MAYVDGETLTNKITDGRMQIAEAMQHAIQIGEALQEADRKGVVYRDNKVVNVMVNSNNLVKVRISGSPSSTDSKTHAPQAAWGGSVIKIDLAAACRLCKDIEYVIKTVQ